MVSAIASMAAVCCLQRLKLQTEAAIRNRMQVCFLGPCPDATQLPDAATTKSRNVFTRKEALFCWA